MTLLRNDSVATELNERRADRNIKKKIQQQSRNININKQDGNADHLRPGSILEEKATSFRSVGARRGDRYINGIVKRRRKRRKKSTINQASIARVMTSRRAKKNVSYYNPAADVWDSFTFADSCDDDVFQSTFISVDIPPPPPPPSII